MAESTGSLQWTDLQSAVGYYLGYGATIGSWNAGQLAVVLDVCKTGYNQFLFPPQLPNEPTQHQWSFLKPTRTINLLAGEGDYPLLYDFGSFFGYMSYSPGMVWGKIQFISEGEIREKRVTFRYTGRPFFAAQQPAPLTPATMLNTTLLVPTWWSSLSNWQITVASNVVTVDTLLPHGLYPGAVIGTNAASGNWTTNAWMGGLSAKTVLTTPTTHTFTFALTQANQAATAEANPLAAITNVVATAIGQRFNVLFYPYPDRNYILTYNYAPRPDAMSATSAYPWGGAAHSETLRASCLAAAEIKVNGEKGVQWDRFQERLRASVGEDRKNSPSMLGMNLDRSDFNVVGNQMPQGFLQVEQPGIGMVLYGDQATYNGIGA